MSDITAWPSAAAATTAAGQATRVEQARAIAEVRAAVMIAMEQPRDLSAAITEMREVCSITALAERAFFRVQRGREYVNGESIHLARELARIFGNIAYGVKELSRDDLRGQSELLAYAWDLQHNSRSEITFMVPHRRDTRNGPRSLTGTQEIYENNASFAGRRLREAIFAVLPVWFKAEAADICHRTLEGQGDGRPLVQRIADLRQAFADIGIGAEQLERKRGRRVDEFLPEDIAALRVIYGSLKRGEVTVADEFPPPEAPQPPPGGKLDAIERAATIPETASPAAGERPGEDRANSAHAGKSPRQGDPSSPADDHQPSPEAASPGGHAKGETTVVPVDRSKAQHPQSAGETPTARASDLASIPPATDLGGVTDWRRYADAAIELIERMPVEERQAVRVSALPRMQALRREDADSYKRVIAALTAAARQEAGNG